jgi:hypothetical protein
MVVRYCGACGNPQSDEGDRFCRFCAAPVSAPNDVQGGATAAENPPESPRATRGRRTRPLIIAISLAGVIVALAAIIFWTRGGGDASSTTPISDTTGRAVVMTICTDIPGYTGDECNCVVDAWFAKYGSYQRIVDAAKSDAGGLSTVPQARKCLGIGP